MDNPRLIGRGLAPFDLYPYNPSKTAGWVFVVIFGIGAAVHFVLMFPLRAWFFIPFILGCVGEAFGYYGRAWSHNNIRDGSPYLLQLMLILGSAPLLAATVYMTLGRFARSLQAEKYTIMSVRWVTKIYVLIDIASFGCQMAGSAMQASSDPTGIKLGQHIVIGGLIVQLIALGWFIFENTILHIRLTNGPTVITLKDPSIPWRSTLWMLRGVSVLIFIRSVYRLIEFTSGSDSALTKHEAFLYVFDASLLSLVAFLFVVIHPGRLFRKIRILTLHSLDEDGSMMLDERP
ncbi:RTA1 domain protein, putative [Talaromyces stipitatus ATCC 10500]|uniref:RTA1 domain protein, putative n=1 Tax=Talaromyces stipitatus (strain ATCC 10500 / CBS 375.48 / QM 6759 / NRRL 1006) TaxID=441959 RepID=B8MBI3_TALSN|nr:RTA1 domain protein, putative [Talaromyces stipitatus ATCC 10500]EED17847.1 RTA1 domain protein, putative [Talaromyces stipitatus ATCC 10500]